VPHTLGPGYVFSGGTDDVAKAAPAPCGDKNDIRLPLGATVALSLLDSKGATFVPAAGQGVDSFSLPGFGGRAAAVQVPVSKSGVQLLPQLGKGQLTIHVAQGTFSCRGDGVSPRTPASTVSVTMTPGRLLYVRCVVAGAP
jgi:hypothetical protein